MQKINFSLDKLIISLYNRGGRVGIDNNIFYLLYIMLYILLYITFIINNTYIGGGINDRCKIVFNSYAQDG